MKNLSKEEVRTAEEMFHASAKKQWLESPGFTSKMGSLGQVPHVCIPAIVELMEEYAAQFKSQSEAVGGVIAMYDFLLEENCELREKLKRYEH